MATGDDAKPSVQPSQVAAVLDTIESHETYAACREIESGRTPREAATFYHATAQALYHKRKDVRSMVALSRAGIHFALTEANRLAATDAEQAAALRGDAKTIAYDLGSNLWPGWQDEGIVLSPADLATGLEAARLNLQLAKELDRPALPRCNAHWLLGAHELARGATAAAREQFALARRQAEVAARPDYEWMCRGYGALAGLRCVPAPADAEREFTQAVAALRELKTDDASFFADQLVAVRGLWTLPVD